MAVLTIAARIRGARPRNQVVVPLRRSAAMLEPEPESNAKSEPQPAVKAAFNDDAETAEAGGVVPEPV